MRPFVVHGEFEAENIDDALNWLAQHFAAILNEDAGPEERTCSIKVLSKADWLGGR